MSKQVLVVSSQPRSIRGRLVMVIVGIGLAVWFFQSPTEAAHGVKVGWNGFVGAVDAVGTFISTVVG